jgi:hypothetical protein
VILVLVETAQSLTISFYETATEGCRLPRVELDWAYARKLFAGRAAIIMFHENRQNSDMNWRPGRRSPYLNTH